MNEYSIPSYCNKLASPGVWGTQVELVATATLTGKPVYVLMNSSRQIQWEVFQAVTKTENLRMTMVGHLELLYNNTTKHYDSFLSKNTGLPHTVEPFIKRYDSFVDLNVGGGSKINVGRQRR